MLKPYRTIQDVLASRWVLSPPAERHRKTDRVLRSTKLESSIYHDLRTEDAAMDEIEQDAGKKLKSFPALSQDVFQSFYSLVPRRNEEISLSVAARKFNAPILEHMTKSEEYPTLKEVCEGRELPAYSVELDVTKGDAKPIWEKLQKYLPVYSLFQADRKNSDSDSEVQDPLHAAVKEILQDEGISQTLDHVAEIVEGKLQEVATRTLEKLREMSPDIANTLSPVIPPASSLKWADVFKAVTISGDESIPINKRGSGSKRLILLNFFRAEVERRKDEANAPGIIYAIEEPETSQHSKNQKKLINALITLSAESNVQVIITTHSAVLVNALDFKNIRLICADGSRKRVEAVHSGQLPFPSLNEVNYLAFSEISEGYHDELYGYLEEQGWLNEYKQGKTTVSYKKINTNGTTREQQICMTEYIRHQIHHPENTYNARFNDLQLRRSIEDMRAFVTSKAQTSGTT